MHGRRLRLISRLSSAIIAIAAVSQGSCTSAPRAADLSSAISRYEEGNYERALAECTTALSARTGVDADRARALAAMSAWKLGRASDAATYAQQASKSSDAATRGRALVVLADTQLARMEYATAAESFEQAAAAFASAQAPADANAARGFAQRARDAIPTRVVVAAPAPEPVTAPKRPATAQTGSTVEPRPTVAAARTAPPTKAAPPRQFTIRAGSYSTLKAAEKRVRAISKDLARANAPDARIEEVTTVSGERLYAVRIGAWPTRADAEKVMGKISRKDLMVGGFESSD